MIMMVLSKGIGLTEIFNYEVLATAFTSSFGNQDSMRRMAQSIQEDLDETLRKNGIQERAILFYTGAWVESAYLAFNSQETYSNSVDSANLKHISSQLEMLQGINYELAQLTSKTREVVALEIELIEFKKLTTSIRVTQISDTVVLNLSDLSEIREKVEGIRNHIVN